MFCFIEIMESVNGVNNSVSAQKNDVNAHMKNTPLNIGVIIPPDAHYKPVLYSDVRATAEFNQLNRDIYDGVKKSKNINEKKTPLSIKILAGIGAICAGIYGITKLIRR
jgi:hypothetical protein